MKIDAVVLAGSPNRGALQGCSSAADEALIKIGRKHMVEYVIDALLAAENVNRIVVAGPKGNLAEIIGPQVSLVDGGETVIETLQRGLELLKSTGPVLVVCSDIPLLTTAAIEDFITRCCEREADFYYPIISQETVKARYPQAQRTYVSLVEGVFTGGNIMLLKPHVLDRLAEVAVEVVKLRKQPVKLCRLLGLKLLLKFFYYKLSISEIEQKVYELLGITGAAVISDYPEIGVDVDKPADLELVMSKLEETA